MGAQQQMLAAASAAAGGWTPLDFGADLAFWANEDSATTESGGTCSQWDDARANGRYISQATSGDRPTVNATGLNGMRTMEFSSSDYMDDFGGTFTSLTKAAGFLGAIVVYQNRSSSSATRTLLAATTNSIASFRFGLRTSNGTTDTAQLAVRRLDADSVANLASTSSSGTAWTILGARMDYANGDGFIDFNGNLADASNLALTTSGSTSNTDSARFRVGASTSNPAAAFADVNIAEILFLAAASKPADSEFDNLYAYLATKWGL